jgi:hypothetical protein
VRRSEHKSIGFLSCETFEMLFDEFHQKPRNGDVAIAAILRGSELDAATDLCGRLDNPQLTSDNIHILAPQGNGLTCPNGAVSRYVDEDLILLAYTVGDCFDLFRTGESSSQGAAWPESRTIRPVCDHEGEPHRGQLSIASSEPGEPHEVDPPCRRFPEATG